MAMSSAVITINSDREIVPPPDRKTLANDTVHGKLPSSFRRTAHVRRQDLHIELALLIARRFVTRRCATTTF
jgi:hypothetical protein